LKKIDANGLVVSSGSCLVYVSAAVYFLRLFAKSSGITVGLDAVESGAIMKYYLAMILTIFGGVMLVLILYRLDSLMRKPAPEWVFAVFGILVPFAIYLGIPPFPE